MPHHDLSNSVSSPSPLHFPSWHVPSETGSILGTSTTGSQTPKQPGYANLAHDFAPHGADCFYGRDFSQSSRGYDAHVPDLPSASSQFIVSPRDMIVPLVPGTMAYPVVYTDDTRVKLTSRVRRQCFNCESKATTTWRRSRLTSGKWVCLSVCSRCKTNCSEMRLQVCNKCGLFERAHAAPRPKAFPRRRRSRSPPASGYPITDVPHFRHLEYRHYDDRSYTGYLSSAAGSTGGDTKSLDTTWMTDIISSTSNRLNPSHIVSPQSTTYRAGSQLTFTAPAEAAYPSSHLSDYRLPM